MPYRASFQVFSPPAIVPLILYKRKILRLPTTPYQYIITTSSCLSVLFHLAERVVPCHESPFSDEPS